MYTLEGKMMRYAIDDSGCCVSVYNKLTAHEYIHAPDSLWKLIYAEGERTEIPVYALHQTFEAIAEPNRLTLQYHALKGDGRILNISLRLVFEMTLDAMSVTAAIDNQDDAQVMEFSLTAVSGVRSLSGDPEHDLIAWPLYMGMKIPNPAFSDLSVYAGYRKYERHDQFHTDLTTLYPAPASMQWYDWYNSEEGLYVGSHDTTHQTVCLVVERDVKLNVLRMGVSRYPLLNKGESYTAAPIVYAPHKGDWHEGARRYRTFMEESGSWKVPMQPQWVRDFKGWLRVILKQHHCELNWEYKDIPSLYDEAEAAGLKTIFLLGWERGGFARRWPDYMVDERMGGERLLKDGITYVHQKGGKVIMFLSYSLIDRQSSFYLNGPGANCTMKDIWNEEIPFSETYCGEGTYRKVGNPPMPMYRACPGSKEWQEKMLESADVCLDLGADGVLYDLGGLPAYFCYDKGHNHAKPSFACESKARHFHEIQDHIRSAGDDHISLMEHNVDIFNQYMDITHSVGMMDSETSLNSMYRYTFPELILTNREHGQDESNYRFMINHTLSYGLRYDMTIFRCCGVPSDIPHYTAYLKEIFGLMDRFSPYLMEGLFRDTDGFITDDPAIEAHCFEAADHTHACTLWNRSNDIRTVTVAFENGQRRTCSLPPQSLHVVTDC
jgi:hypothetical protein